MNMPLRFTIPIILLLFISALATWSLHTNGKIAEENIEKESKDRLTLILTRLQGSVEQALRKNNLEWAQEEIAGLGNDPDIELGILVDENGKVLASTKIVHIGFMLQEVFPSETRKETFLPSTLIKKSKSSLAANVVTDSEGKSLFGIVPIQLGSNEGFIRPTRLGMLFANLSIIDLKAAARETVRQQVVQFYLVLGLLTIGLGLFLHYNLTKRIQQLVLAAKAFGKGEFQTHINVGGGDEITMLANSMSAMAEKRRQVEAELEEHKNRLEELVDDRTKELENSQLQLIHSEKLTSLGKLTGSISHEFNNPLQGIRTAIAILSKSSHSDKEAKLAEAGIKECDRMAKMIKGLRDFYKPTSSVFCAVDINQCLEEVLTLQNESLVRKGIQVNQQFSDHLPQVEIVEDQIKQVILNFIQNSADSISGEGQITLVTEQQDSHLKIKIQDTGHGILGDDIENLFDPFFTTKATEQGTGLGLSVSYGIIRDHGGDIEVESELEKGTTFTIRLPIKR